MSRSPEGIAALTEPLTVVSDELTGEEAVGSEMAAHEWLMMANTEKGH